MSNGELGWITNFIWGIADDVLRDLYVRGKYRDVILLDRQAAEAVAKRLSRTRLHRRAGHPRRSQAPTRRS